jgi:nucleoside-triphosphatase THEP1
VDELGVLELGADDLARRLAAVFQGPAGVLAVIQQRAFERWMAILDPRTLTHVFTVDSSTRNDLPARIAALFQA